MTQEYITLDISGSAELQRLAHAVRESGRPYALQEGTGTVALLGPVPVKKPRSVSPERRRRRSRVFTKDDPLWGIVGLIKGDDGANDVSSHIDEYLADAYLDTHE